MTEILLGYMSVANGLWMNESSYYLDPNEIIIDKTKIKIIFSYPLTKAFTFEYLSNDSKGFTRKEISEYIMTQYKDIYNEEEANQGHPGFMAPNILNRAQSYGKYGIWGHDIEDLYLHTLYENKDEDNIYTLGIDS
jgi:hypothetical protein